MLGHIRRDFRRCGEIRFAEILFVRAFEANPDRTAAALCDGQQVFVSRELLCSGSACLLQDNAIEFYGLPIEVAGQHP